MSPFSAVGTTSVPASTQVGRERFGELGSVSSTSSTMSPLSQSPAQVMSYRGREGSFESRYQSPIDDFRVSQETLLDQMDPQSRRGPVTSPRTDDVTDCCDCCFHGNAHHRFGLHFRELSLLRFLLYPRTPMPLFPSLCPTEEEEEGKDTAGGADRKLTAAERKKKQYNKKLEG
ncbi:hypothetical protein XENOCAPTIV_028120 [Xenoophorus captivus]|uniref:Uncharacterized protein n=1 Tax=Xenoophorus captivus TaxID=1517983 RepID=A0ABV0RW86_9TELE